MAVSSNSTAADTVVQGPGAAEPIAVIGLACRLPGAPDPHGLWKLLSEGRSAVTERPVGRTGDSDGAAAQAHPGLRFGGYLPAIDGFDPEFFGISPREAAAMDPQQRLVLELSWEAIEDAGLLPAALRGGATGVFIGSIADEYAALSRAAGPGRHTLTGTTRGIIANRVSHTLGLRGPSIAVDTAQSSSLVAVHLACESLRRGEAALALAGGVNLIVDPLGSVAVAQFGGLSPDGRCYTFDRRANGYVRAEGAGLVLLKPLAAALADGDRVHAVILGSAVNNDGGGTGLTVPSERAQAAVIRKACAAAGVTPGDLQYVELHGTGTPVGDPLEARGLWLARAEGAGPVDGETAPEVLDVGSVKTNLGHLEGAAGIAGLLKAVLGVARRELPATLNHDDPNPEIDLVGWRLRVRTRLGAWPRPERPLLAGVSSFGMGGTNCHVVLGEAPRAVESASATDASLGPILLSGRTVPALRAQAARLRDALDGGAGLRVDEGTADAEGGAGEGQDRLLPTGLAYALATRRTAFRERAAVTGVADAAGLRSALDALAHGRPAAGVLSGSAHGEGTVALLFPGQGSQRGGMARLAGAQSQVWRAALAQAAEVLDPWLPEPVEGLLFADPGSPQAALLDRTEYTQPALFAVEVATARYLASLGVTPAFVAGHSIGEVAAAHLAGVLDLPSAARLIAARGRLMGALPSGGGMLGIGASEADVTAMIASLGDSVAIAAVNGPSSVVVAGPKELLVELAEQCDARNVRTRPLAVSHAFHSPLMEPMLDEFREELRQLTFNDVSLPFVSTVTGELMAGEAAAGHDWVEHWVEHARRPVRFADALRCLRELGVGAFVEAGPGTVLSGLGREITGSTAHIPVLGKDGDLDGALARLFTSGVELDWRQALPNPDGRWVELPGYAFQRERYWLDNSGGQSESAPTAAPVSAPAAEPPAELAARMLPAAPDGGVIDRLVLAELAATLGFTDPARVDPDTTFKDLGLDSLGLVEFRDRLGAALGRELPAGVLFGHPTATALSGFLRAPVAARPSAAAVSAGGSDDPVVIVGMGCRFPGGVSSPEELWELVASGADATGDFPTDRGWDLEALFAGASATRRGGFLHDVAEFDAGFFGISPREAAAMDPQQRLLLQVSWEALERAGIDPHALKDTDTGVFIGASPSDYTPRLHEADDASVGGYLLTGSALSVASGRIAYVLGLRGRALTVDTACSSSLVAL
ncbi:type I polyketide synthase, partial [Kitasatospora sp. NPDC092948]|uniref:type I polyketide synthase n=1 Tax=Kitasatospora sp. NPDC092948 TaxID=3364088 RepID=UPI00381EA9A4